MTINIREILAKRDDLSTPKEVEIIKAYVQKHFNHLPNVTIHKTQIVIGVSNAAMAGALRTRLHELQELSKTSKRLIIRIS